MSVTFNGRILWQKHPNIFSVSTKCLTLKATPLSVLKKRQCMNLLSGLVLRTAYTDL